MHKPNRTATSVLLCMLACALLCCLPSAAEIAPPSEPRVRSGVAAVDGQHMHVGGAEAPRDSSLAAAGRTLTHNRGCTSASCATLSHPLLILQLASAA